MHRSSSIEEPSSVCDQISLARTNDSDATCDLIYVGPMTRRLSSGGLSRLRSFASVLAWGETSSAFED